MFNTRKKEKTAARQEARKSKRNVENARRNEKNSGGAGAVALKQNHEPETDQAKCDRWQKELASLKKEKDAFFVHAQQECEWRQNARIKGHFAGPDSSRLNNRWQKFLSAEKQLEKKIKPLFDRLYPGVRERIEQERREKEERENENMNWKMNFFKFMIDNRPEVLYSEQQDTIENRLFNEMPNISPWNDPNERRSVIARRAVGMFIQAGQVPGGIMGTRCYHKDWMEGKEDEPGHYTMVPCRCEIRVMEFILCKRDQDRLDTGNLVIDETILKAQRELLLKQVANEGRAFMENPWCGPMSDNPMPAYMAKEIVQAVGADPADVHSDKQGNASAEYQGEVLEFD
jgi:hypothetical protein